MGYGKGMSVRKKVPMGEVLLLLWGVLGRLRCYRALWGYHQCGALQKLPTLLGTLLGARFAFFLSFGSWLLEVPFAPLQIPLSTSKLSSHLIASQPPLSRLGITSNRK